jgi:GTPase involved in cell partitioning and DNA repair
MLYLKGSLGLGLGQGVNVDLSKADYWLSMAGQTIGSGSEYQEDLAELKAELKTAQYEVRKREEIQRAERLEKIQKLEREQLALQRQKEESERLSKLEAKRQKGPSFAELLIGAVFQAVGEGIASGVKAKVHQELGVRNYDPNSIREERLDEMGKRARREAQRVIRMEKIQKNLRTQPSIGYQY